jgi:trans-aconitate methyltransferase
MVNYSTEVTVAGQQTWNSAHYAQHAHFVPQLGAGVLELLAPQAGERILDLGCGDGVLTAQLHERGCDVLGIDASPQLAAAAQARGLDVQVKRGEELDFESGFDAVFSNAALHWMKPPERVIAGVWRALRPGGRFVAEMGGDGCVAKIRAALGAALSRRGIDAVSCDPWYFPAAEDYGALLERAGFRIRSLVLFPRPTPLPTDVVGWLTTFAQSFLAPLPASEHAAFLAEVRDALEPELLDAGTWVADYTRLRFAADKPK